MSDKRFFGKYRGTVLNNIDPMMMGRIQAIVPDVTGLIPSSWAMPCFPVAGNPEWRLYGPNHRLGGLDRVRAWRSRLSNLDRLFYGSAAEVPAMALIVPPGVPGITLQTPLQNSLTISDVPGPTGGILH